MLGGISPWHKHNQAHTHYSRKKNPPCHKLNYSFNGDVFYLGVYNPEQERKDSPGLSEIKTNQSLFSFTFSYMYQLIYKMFCVRKAETYGDTFWAKRSCAVCIWGLCSDSVSCVVVPVPAVGEVRGCLRVRHLFVYVCGRPRPVLTPPWWAVLFPGCRCWSEITSCRLPPVSESAGSSHFLSTGKGKLKGNRMSIPGRTGQGRLGEVEGEGDDPGNGGEGRGYMGAPYPSLHSLLRVDSDVFFDINKRQSLYSCIFRWNYREIPEWLLDVGSNNQICLSPRFTLMWRS